MAESAEKPRSDAKPARTSGWYVLLLAWLIYATAFFLLSKSLVKPAADVTNYQMIELGRKYSSFVGAGIGLATLLVTCLLYAALRFFSAKARRIIALALTVAGYSVWLVFGYDLVYLEPRYAEIARAIITYLGKPMLYASTIVVGCAGLGAALTLALGRSKKSL